MSTLGMDPLLTLLVVVPLFFAIPRLHGPFALTPFRVQDTLGKALAGMVTDRDITVRGVASGMIPQEALVSDVMTEEVRFCRADDSVEQVMAAAPDSTSQVAGRRLARPGW